MNNAVYYHAAYVVVVVVLAAYAGSLWWRGRDLARREAAVRRDGLATGDARERR